MKLLLILLALISCKEKPENDVQDLGIETAPRIEIADKYTMNGDDFTVAIIDTRELGDYTYGFILTREDGDYIETVKLKRKIRSLVETDSTNSIADYNDGVLSGGRTRSTIITGTDEYLEFCRKEIVDNDYEYVCETFEVVE